MFELKEELQLFVNDGNKIEDKFSNNYFLQQLAYLVYMLKRLNNLNLQGPEMTGIQLIRYNQRIYPESGEFKAKCVSTNFP